MKTKLSIAVAILLIAAAGVASEAPLALADGAKRVRTVIAPGDTETISLTARSSVPDGIQRTESLRVYVRATFHGPGGTFVKNFGEVIP